MGLKGQELPQQPRSPGGVGAGKGLPPRPPSCGWRLPFSGVAIPQDFLRLVSGAWHLGARGPGSAVASCGAGSRWRVRMVSGRGATGSTEATVPGTVPDPRSFSQCWQSPGLATPSWGPHRQLLVPRQGVWGPGPGRLAGGCWPGSGAGIKCQPGGWTVQERIRCQQSGSPGGQWAGQPGAEQVPGSQSTKYNICSLGAGETCDVMGTEAKRDMSHPVPQELSGRARTPTQDSGSDCRSKVRARG